MFLIWISFWQPEYCMCWDLHNTTPGKVLLLWYFPPNRLLNHMLSFIFVFCVLLIRLWNRSSRRKKGLSVKNRRGRRKLDRRRNWPVFSSWRPVAASKRRSCGGWRWRKSEHWSYSGERRSSGSDCFPTCWRKTAAKLQASRIRVALKWLRISVIQMMWYLGSWVGWMDWRQLKAKKSRCPNLVLTPEFQGRIN